MSDETILPLLARMFPSFAGIPPDEARRRGDALGRFAAHAWTAGPQVLAQRGVIVPPHTHQALAGQAPQVAQTGQGGVAFLSRMRPAYNDDHKFAAALAGLAKLYGESLRGGWQPPPIQAAPPAQPAGGGFSLPGPPSAPGGGPPLDFAPAPAPAPTPAPAPAPQAGGHDFGSLDLAPAPEPRRSSWEGGLDLAPEPGGAPATAPAPAPTAPAPMAPAPSAPGGGGMGGGLDLLDDDDSGGGRPSYEDLMYGAPDAEAEALSAPGAPKEPVARALWSFERTGETSYLDQAQQALEQQLQSAPHAMAAATAQAGLAKVALMRGDRATAEQTAQAALARFPGCPDAIEVMVRAARGDAEAANFARLLVGLRFAIDQRDVGTLKARGVEMAQAFPDEPLPHLALFFAAHVQGDKQALERHLKLAWQRFPSPAYPERSFGGGGPDADVANSLNLYGRAPFKNMEEEGLLRTITDVDSKDNLIAGSLRMAVGLSKVALTQPGLDRPALRRLHVAVGQGLMGLQYFELAPEEMSKAMLLAPTPEEVKAVGNERVQCQALWRAFDKPGIKNQKGRFRCLASEAVTRKLQEQLETIRKDREQREGELHDKGPDLLARAQQDAAFRQEIGAAAEEYAQKDPIGAIEEIDAQLARIAQERAAEAAGGGGKGGLFGKLKKAVGDAAKGAQLKFKESQLQSQREDAVRRLAHTLAHDLYEYDFKHPMLAAFSRRAASLDAFLDYLKEEEARVHEGLRSLAFSKK